MGGTGSKPEDQIITAAIEQATGAKLTYIPYKGGGDVAAHWSAGMSIPASTTRSRPWPMAGRRTAALVHLRRQRRRYKEPIADGKSWADIPTCKEAGLPIEYKMLRGIFTTPGATQEQVAFYVELLEKVRGTD